MGKNVAVRRLVKIRSRIFLFAFCLSLVGELFAQAYNPNSTEEIELMFEPNGKSETYVIALDQVGLLLNENGSLDDAIKLMNEYNGEIIQSQGGGFVILKLPEAVGSDRREIGVFARNFRSSFPAGQVGLVLYRSGYATPLVATDQLVIEFNEGVTKLTIEKFARDSGLVLLVNDPKFPQQWLLRLGQDTEHDVITASSLASEHPDVKFALPNFYVPITTRQFTPNDPLFGTQWHHINSGQEAGTFDADIDSELAWALTQGNEDILIAIIDEGFDVDHEDLALNVWRNSGETGPDLAGNEKASNNLDDDGNNHIDDVNGYNFTDCYRGGSANSPPNCGHGEISGQEHGTLVAGVAAGRGNNAKGITGVCPRCSLMLLQQENAGNHWGAKYAFNYAIDEQAHIISNSWGYPYDVQIPTYLRSTIELAISEGIVVLFAMDNHDRNECEEGFGAFLAIEGVLAISAATNWDNKVIESGYGNCIDLLAPSHRGYLPATSPAPNPPSSYYTGTLNIATTDRPGIAGLNNVNDPNNHPRTTTDFCNEVSLADDPDRNYTLCFGGTSASTPVVAGIGGLILSVDDSLSRVQIQNLLQDTADKIQPGIAKYGSGNGRSSHDNTSSHGYGRVNAFEAVRVVAPVTATGVSGLGGTDLFIRDNELDWGNTAQLVENGPPWRGGSNVYMEKVRGVIGHYQSVDIKVDAPPYQNAPTNSMDFDDDFVHENPVSGAINKVYVRVHNRGPDPASDVQVKLYWAMAGTALPPLPNDFWSASPTLPSAWNSLGTRNIASVGYSGASVAGTGADQSQIVSFDFTGPALDPSLPAFRHHCLLAVIDSPDDPVNETRLVPDIVTPTNNNVTHRNLSVQDAATTQSGGFLMVRNPFPWSISTRLKVVKPKRWNVSVSKFGDSKPFRLESGKEVPIEVEIIRQKGEEPGVVEIRQEIKHKESYQPFGGFTYLFTEK